MARSDRKGRLVQVRVNYVAISLSRVANLQRLKVRGFSFATLKKFVGVRTGKFMKEESYFVNFHFTLKMRKCGKICRLGLKSKKTLLLDQIRRLFLRFKKSVE